jgi:leishmanolysin
MPDRDFDIDFTYRGNEAYRNAFEEAAKRWEQIITADLPDVGRVDDIFIKARVIEIDGKGDFFGHAWPSPYVRSDSGLPVKGIMEFDKADMREMSNGGILTGVIMHEMGHVLGLGTLWDTSYFDFVNYERGGYTGENALQEYRRLSGDSSATYVPLETGGGRGTAYSHWSEDVFDVEMMTGYGGYGDMPISRVTIGALEDLGYTVSYAQADPYHL